MDWENFMAMLTGGNVPSPNQSGSSYGVLNPDNAPGYAVYKSPYDLGNLASKSNDGGSSWDFMSKLMGNDKEMGPLAKGVGIGSALLQGFTGWKNYGLQKDKFDFEKEAYNKNYANQVQSYNTQLANQANQKASATGDFAGAQDYINRHRLS